MRLKKHVAVHAGNDTKPLECTDCGKRFLTNSALAGHIKMHVLPDALYDCPIYSQEFEQVSSLKDHVYEHREMVFSLVLIVKKFLKSILA